MPLSLSNLKPPSLTDCLNSAQILPFLQGGLKSLCNQNAFLWQIVGSTDAEMYQDQGKFRQFFRYLQYIVVQLYEGTMKKGRRPGSPLNKFSSVEVGSDPGPFHRKTAFKGLDRG